MPDTHINAYFADVEEKLKAVQLAQGELQAAKNRLETKKKEVGFKEESTEEPVAAEQSVAQPEAEKKLTKPNNSVSNVFKKK